MIREYDRRLESMVQWSLLVIAGVATLMVGFGWYTNFRVYERDKAALQSTLEAVVREHISGLDQRVTDTLRRQEEALRTYRAELQKSLFKPIDEAKNELRRELDEFRLEFLEHTRPTKESVDYLAYSHHLETFQLALSLGHEPRAGKALDAIVTLLSKKDKFYADDMAELRAILDKLPSSLYAYKDAVGQHLARMKPESAGL